MTSILMKMDKLVSKITLFNNLKKIWSTNVLMPAVSAIEGQNLSLNLKQKLWGHFWMSIKNKSNSFIISIQMEICGYTHIMEESIMISKQEIPESFQYSKKSKNKLNFLMEIKTMEILSNSSERRLEETWMTGF